MKANRVLIRVSKLSTTVFLQRQVMFGILFFLLCVNQVGAQTYVTSAVELQNALTNGHTNIQVRHGEYQLTKTLVVKTGVTITGGYTALNTRGGQGSTTLKAKNGQRVITLEGGTVDGFTITGGNDDIAGGVYFRIGGTLKNCLITKNTDTDGVGVGGDKNYTNKVQYCTIADNVKGTFNYVTVKNIRWAEGNLRGNTGMSASIGGPREIGDVAHLASLMLYPITTINTNSLPSAYSDTRWNKTFANIPGTDNVTGNTIPSDNAGTGVGDPCRFYLRGAWRMPKESELQELTNVSYSRYSNPERFEITADLPEQVLTVMMTGWISSQIKWEGQNASAWWWADTWGKQTNGSDIRSRDCGRTLAFQYSNYRIEYHSNRYTYDGSSFRCIYATDKTN